MTLIDFQKYVDQFLYPLAIKHPSYIKDTPDFLDKLSSIKPDPESLLFTLDVESLYTNIDNYAGLEAVKKLFRIIQTLKDQPQRSLIYFHLC